MCTFKEYFCSLPVQYIYIYKTCLDHIHPNSPLSFANMSPHLYVIKCDDDDDDNLLHLISAACIHMGVISSTRAWETYK